MIFNGRTVNVVASKPYAELEAAVNSHINNTENPHDVTRQQLCTAPAEESEEYAGCYFRMVDGVMEWINPPVIIDEEYRTTERFMGKTVYTKLFNCGQLAANGTAKYFSHGISGQVIRCAGCMSKDDFTTSVPIPYYVAINGNVSDVVISANALSILIEAKSGNFTEYTMFAQLWYTKG